MKQQYEIRHTFNEWLESMHNSKHQAKNQLNKGTFVILVQQQQFDDVVDDLEVNEIENEFEIHNLDVVTAFAPRNSEIVNKIARNNPATVKIDLINIQNEIDFWNSSPVCYIIGANPPIQVTEGFIRRILIKN